MHYNEIWPGYSKHTSSRQWTSSTFIFIQFAVYFELLGDIVLKIRIMTIESENCTTRLILIEPIANKASFNITKGMYSDEHLLHELTPNSHIGTVLRQLPELVFFCFQTGNRYGGRSNICRSDTQRCLPWGLCYSTQKTMGDAIVWPTRCTWRLPYRSWRKGSLDFYFCSEVSIW